MKNKIARVAALVFLALSGPLTMPLKADPTSCIEGKHYINAAFIAKEANQVLTQIGNCDVRHAPFSTFKVPLALMGFDAGLLQTKELPKWSFKKEYEKHFGAWYNPKTGLKLNWHKETTPATFIKNSVLWYSHQITQKLGARAFASYVSKLGYGNQDVSGTPGKDDGLFQSWLGTSLVISPREQVAFLEKLLVDELPVSQAAQAKTKELLKREETLEGWQVYGKTGGGAKGQQWFIGWIEKGSRHIVFAQYLEKGPVTLNPPVRLALAVAKENLSRLLRG